jgi:hypothetical protein
MHFLKEFIVLLHLKYFYKIFGVTSENNMGRNTVVDH